MSRPKSGRRKCVWLNCRRSAQHFGYCYSHWPALGEVLQKRLMASTPATSAEVLEDCRKHALATVEWRRTHVTGGSDVDTDKAAG